MSIPNGDGWQDKSGKVSKWSHWDSDQAAGKRGENAWALHMQHRGYQVFEATIEQNKAGIDMFCSKDGEVTTFDTKNDRVAHRTGNLGLEDYSIYHKDGRHKDGWARKANCDWFCILEEVEMGIYVYHLIKADEVVAKLDQVREDYKSLCTKRDPNKVTWNVIVPKKDMHDIFDSYTTGPVDNLAGRIN